MKIAIVATITDKLKAATSKKEKLEILHYYKSETLYKRLLSYTYNPLINFNMNDWKPKHYGKMHGQGISKFMHIPEDIFQGKFTKEEAIFACNMAMMHINTREAILFEGMLHKDLGIDVDIDIINEVWPNLIPKYPVQMPVKYEPSIHLHMPFPAVVQPMSRGLRVNIVIRGNSVEFRDKNGKILESFNNYIEQFSNLAQNGSTVFDGHAVVVDDDMNIIGTDDSVVLAAKPENVRFILWDCIRYDGFVDGKDNRIGYNWRFNGLEHMMFLAIDKNPTPCYRAAESKIVSSVQEAEQYAKEIKNPIVLKNLSGTWKNGPTSDELIIHN